ncbi:hypothetical protein DYBT9275_05967 [Dyadobacter sp. CECT 9275]|uniref:Uncharacterized protein n=1 Tax=Dyadobacter helix TaxID=2822344 RepID=A0A916JJV7_9BACT|nr:hypothetical protein DYBT9275_05967 [Dyadobacter sp. CECT 9275]
MLNSFQKYIEDADNPMTHNGTARTNSVTKVHRLEYQKSSCEATKSWSCLLYLLIVNCQAGVNRAQPFSAFAVTCHCCNKRTGFRYGKTLRVFIPENR